jgi:glutaminyl-peptide cyclotransferase
VANRLRNLALGVMLATVACIAGCSRQTSSANDGAASGISSQAESVPAAPDPATTGGFDCARAYKHVAELVAIGPHSAGSEGIRRAQAYLVEQLKSSGCPVEDQDFHASTPVGNVAMKNILVKIPSANPNIVLYATHYDSKRLPNFVGADDGGSSTGVILELARLLCARKNAVTVWLAFLDGEEAFNLQWADPDNTYGSRELAASLALSGMLPRVKAMILADMIGPANLRIKRESNSTPWLTDLIWSTAERLGYGKVFVNDRTPIEDDHLAFLARGVAACDVIAFDDPITQSFWHTSRDTLDKVDPRSLAITGHVLLESLPDLEKKLR